MSDSVLIGGVFDPLHAGHLAYIKEAQTFGVAVDCALSNAPQKHPCLLPIKQRAKLLKALGVRDVYQHKTGAELVDMIRTLKPRAYVKGKDWEGKLPDEQVKACHDVGANIVFTNTAFHSSSAILAEYERQRNAEKLEAFEDFVLYQKPAEKPWEPVTDYSWDARVEAEGPHAQLIKEAFDPVEVLDVGCGPGHLVLMLKAIGVHHVCGIDKAPSVNEAISQHDIVTLDPQHGDFRPQHDLVICREVLEHLTVRQLAIAVRNLVKLSSKYVYVTTRFTAKSHLLDVDGSDLLDPTHISMLNQDLLRTLFVLEGCRRRRDLEAKLDWKQLGRVLVYEVPA